MNRPTVLHVTEAFGGGIVSAIGEIVARTPELEHHMLRAVRPADHTSGEGESGLAGVSDLPAGGLAAMREIRRTIARLQPDVVHAHSSYAGAYVRLAVSARRIRVVYTPQGYGYLRTDIGRLSRLLVRTAEHVLTWNTTAIAACSAHEATLASSGCRSMERYLVPNAVALPPLPHRPRDEGTVVAVGRLMPIRDPEYFLRVAESVRSRRPEARLRWLGGRDGQVADRLRAAGVEVTGWLPRPELLAELAGAGVYVHTAAWDGFPMTVLEAVGLGVPTVGRRTPQLVECPAAALFDSPESLADGVIALLDDPPTADDHRRRWQRFLDDHSPEVQRRAILSAYGLDRRAER